MKYLNTCNSPAFLNHLYLLKYRQLFRWLPHLKAVLDYCLLDARSQNREDQIDVMQER